MKHNPRGQGEKRPSTRHVASNAPVKIEYQRGRNFFLADRLMSEEMAKKLTGLTKRGLLDLVRGENVRFMKLHMSTANRPRYFYNLGDLVAWQRTQDAAEGLEVDTTPGIERPTARMRRDKRTPDED